MTDIEMDLVIAKAEVLSLQKTIREQADLLANQRNHIAALQSIIEKQCNMNTKAVEALVGDCYG